MTQKTIKTNKKNQSFLQKFWIFEVFNFQMALAKLQKQLYLSKINFSRPNFSKNSYCKPAR